MNGGLREGAGRPKGAKNKAGMEVRDLLDEIVDFRVLIGKLQELSHGVTVAKIVKGKPVIYVEKPDSFAAKILMEYRFGKPIQQIEAEITGEITEIRRTVINRQR